VVAEGKDSEKEFYRLVSQSQTLIDVRQSEHLFLRANQLSQ
jgi:hypothetical protein